MSSPGKQVRSSYATFADVMPRSSSRYLLSIASGLESYNSSLSLSLESSSLCPATESAVLRPSFLPLQLAMAVMLTTLPFWPVCACILTKCNFQVLFDLVIEVPIDMSGVEKPDRATLRHRDLDGSLRFLVSMVRIIELIDSPETISTIS